MPAVLVRDEGQIRKVLSFKMLADKTTFSLRLAVTTVGAGRTQNFEVPVTPGEMEMLKVLAQVTVDPEPTLHVVHGESASQYRLTFPCIHAESVYA